MLQYDNNDRDVSADGFLLSALTALLCNMNIMNIMSYLRLFLGFLVGSSLDLGLNLAAFKCVL